MRKLGEAIGAGLGKLFLVVMGGIIASVIVVNVIEPCPAHFEETE